MKIRMLLCAEHINPVFFRAVSDGKAIGTVFSPTEIAFQGQVLKPIDHKLILGERFKIGYSGNQWHIEYLSDIDRHRRHEQAAKNVAEQEANAKADQEKSLAFWAQYDIPIAFVVEIKEVLSGLQVNGNGCGMKRNTVTHIYCLSDFSDKRLVRSANTFLCSPVKARYGGDWTGTLGEGLTVPYVPIISCKECLKKMEKWKIGKSYIKQ